MKTTAVIRLIFCVVGLSAAAAAAADRPTDRAVPVQVEADRMESLQQQQAVLFTGNVEARQGELLLNADEMTVHYLDTVEGQGQPASAGRKVDRLVARGNVKIQSSTWTASGTQVEFQESSRKVVLEGGAKVWRNNNLVTGDRVILYLDEGKSVVEKAAGTGERVKAFFYPDQNSAAGRSAE